MADEEKIVSEEKVVPAVLEETKEELPYRTKVKRKIIETLISVKVLLMVVVFGVSTFLVYLGKIDGTNYTTLNCTVITAVIAMREGFKVFSINGKNETLCSNCGGNIGYSGGGMSPYQGYQGYGSSSENQQYIPRMFV